MEDKDILAIFNGEDTPKNNNKVPKMSDKDVLGAFSNRTSDTKNTMFNNANSTPISHNTEGTFKLGNDDVFNTNQRDDADAQSFGKQLGLFTANTVANVASGTIGGIGYLGTLFEDKKGDYSNAITDWADSVRNPFGEIKRKNNETIDLTDSAFWLNSGQSVVESAIQFGIIAETGGLAGVAVVSKLGSLLKLGNTAMKGIKAGIQGLTSVELSYLEGAMSGATVYRDIYKKQYDNLIGKGLSIDEANTKAKEFAANGASSTVQLNTTIGSLLNLTGIGSVFNREAHVAERYFTQGLGKRIANESIPDYTARLMKQSPEFLNKLTKQNYGRLASEMTQEGIEEVVTQLAENTGRDEGSNSKNVGYLDSFQSAYNNINSVLNDEGLLNFGLGAIGGIGQTVLLDNVVRSQRVNKLSKDGNLVLDVEETKKQNKPVYQTQLLSPRKRDIYDNEIFYNNMKDTLVSDLNNIQDIQNKLATTTDKVKKEELYRKLFAVNTNNSIYKGTGDNLIADYEKILKQDNTIDLSIDLKKQADELLTKIESNKQLLSTDLDEDTKKRVEEEQKVIVPQYTELAKQQLANEGKTIASNLGLSTGIGDNNYQIRASKAISHIKQLSELHKKNKDKYILPEETKVNFADYVTKLQGDILGRKSILQDLDNDFNTERADFQMFSGIEEYGNVQNILANSELTSYYNERNDIVDRIKQYDTDKDISIFSEIADNLKVKVNDEADLSRAMSKKLDDIDKSIKDKEENIKQSIINSKSFKDSKFDSLEKYLDHFSKKNTDYNNVVNFSASLHEYRRNIDNIQSKLDYVTSNKGRSNYINNQNERIKLESKQIEANHNIYSYQEAVQMADETYYNSKIEELDNEEKDRLKKEIEDIKSEIVELEKQIELANDKSRFSSFLNYFNNLRSIEQTLSLRKQRLNQIVDYLKRVDEIKETAKNAINTDTTLADKEVILEEAKTGIKNESDVLNTQEDNADDIMSIFNGLTDEQKGKLLEQKVEVQVNKLKSTLNNNPNIQMVREVESTVDDYDDFNFSIDEDRDEETYDEELGDYVEPFTLNMLNTRYGNTDENGLLTKDMITNYDLLPNSQVEIRLNNPTAEEVKQNDKVANLKENRISFFLSGSNTLIGHLPTMEFLKTTYKKVTDRDNVKEDNTKEYWLNKDGYYSLQHELDVLELEMNNFDFSEQERNDVIEDTNGYISVNYSQYNEIMIGKIRMLFSKNPNLVIKSNLKSKSEGRINTSAVNNKLDISKNNDSRVRIHLNLNKVLSPAIIKPSGYSLGKYFAYLSFPTTSGRKKITPLILNKINKTQVDSITEIMNLFFNDRDAFNTLYSELGMISNSTIKGNTIKQVLEKYFINFSNEPINGVKTVKYFPKDEQFVFNDGQGNNHKIDKNNFAQFTKYAETALSQSTFTLDKKSLEKDYNQEFKYPIFENGSVQIKSAKDYYEYAEKNIETKAIINSENRDSKREIIYVKDFVLNFNSAFYNKKNNVSIIKTIIKDKQIFNSKFENKNNANLLIKSILNGNFNKDNNKLFSSSFTDEKGVIFNKEGKEIFNPNKSNEENVNQVEKIIEQLPIEPDKKKESNLKSRKKLDKPKDLDESKDDDTNLNVFDYKKSDSNFIEEYKKSEIPYQKFIADIFEDNVANNSELDKTLYNRAYFTHAFKNVTSLEQATELFHKICK